MKKTVKTKQTTIVVKGGNKQAPPPRPCFAFLA